MPIRTAKNFTLNRRMRGSIRRGLGSPAGVANRVAYHGAKGGGARHGGGTHVPGAWGVGQAARRRRIARTAPRTGSARPSSRAEVGSGESLDGGGGSYRSNGTMVSVMFLFTA